MAGVSLLALVVSLLTHSAFGDEGPFVFARQRSEIFASGVEALRGARGNAVVRPLGTRTQVAVCAGLLGGAAAYASSLYFKIEPGSWQSIGAMVGGGVLVGGGHWLANLSKYEDYLLAHGIHSEASQALEAISDWVKAYQNESAQPRSGQNGLEILRGGFTPHTHALYLTLKERIYQQYKKQELNPDARMKDVMERVGLNVERFLFHLKAWDNLSEAEAQSWVESLNRVFVAVKKGEHLNATDLEKISKLDEDFLSFAMRRLLPREPH